MDSDGWHLRGYDSMPSLDEVLLTANDGGKLNKPSQLNGRDRYIAILEHMRDEEPPESDPDAEQPEDSEEDSEQHSSYASSADHVLTGRCLPLSAWKRWRTTTVLSMPTAQSGDG